MENRNRNVTTLGLLVLIAAGLFIWGLFFLQGNPLLARGMNFVVELEDGRGLTRGDRVHLQGVEVGSVRSVKLDPPGRVLVEVRLDSEILLPADTRAVVRTDVFGAHALELRPGVAVVRLEPGDTIQGLALPGMTDVVTDLGTRAGAILTAADSLLGSKAVVDMQATASILPASAEELRLTFVELRQAAGALRRSVEDLERSSPGGTVARTGDAMERALVQLEGSATAMSSAAAALERSMVSLSSVLDKVDRGDGLLGLMVNDGSLYLELSEAVRELRALAVDVRERPDRYMTLRIF